MKTARLAYRQMRWVTGLAIAASLTVAASPARAAVIYVEDFEGGVKGPEWTGAGGVETTGGLSAFGFGRLHLRNAGSTPTQLSLTGLAPHTEVVLAFSLAMWDSIDLGDAFTITANGATLYTAAGNFGNYFPIDGVSHGPGVHISDPFTAFATPNYGYNGSFRDAAQAVSFTFAHTASSLDISFLYGNSQGGLDESFGLDNVRVSTDTAPPPPVPEPASLALIGLGLAAVAAARRR